MIVFELYTGTCWTEFGAIVCLPEVETCSRDIVTSDYLLLIVQFVGSNPV
jgi:hypothetical protein